MGWVPGMLVRVLKVSKGVKNGRQDVGKGPQGDPRCWEGFPLFIFDIA